MAQTTIAPLLQAIVQTLKANASLVAGLPGGIHEGLAPFGTAYPFLTYQMHYSPIDYDWTGVLTRAGVDLVVHTRDQVEGRTLDQLVMDTMQNADFDFSTTQLGSSGQSTLYCRREMDLSSADLDGEGRKLYLIGAQYEIWIDQAQ
jgi:hypothetical protein